MLDRVEVVVQATDHAVRRDAELRGDGGNLERHVDRGGFTARRA